jgi:hypothetical protein
MIMFQAGQSYEMRSVCDFDCVLTYKVTRRSGQSIWIYDIRSKNMVAERRKITTFNGVETCRPLGSYSMAPILTAEKAVQS